MRTLRQGTATPTFGAGKSRSSVRASAETPTEMVLFSAARVVRLRGTVGPRMDERNPGNGTSPLPSEV